MTLRVSRSKETAIAWAVPQGWPVSGSSSQWTRRRNRASPPAEPEHGLREEFAHHRAMMERQSRAERSSRSRPAIFAALVLVLVVLGIGLAGFEEFTGFMDDWSGRSERGIAASGMQETPATTPKLSATACAPRAA